MKLKNSVTQGTDVKITGCVQGKLRESMTV